MAVNKVYVILNRLLWLFVFGISQRRVIRVRTLKQNTCGPVTAEERAPRLWKYYCEGRGKHASDILIKITALSHIHPAPALWNNMRIKTTNEENLGATLPPLPAPAYVVTVNTM